MSVSTAKAPTTPANTPGSSASAPVVDQNANPYKAYDLSSAESDYTTWRSPLTQWFTTILVEIERAAELQQPLTPYVEILGSDGQNSVVQWIDSTMRNWGDGLSAIFRTEQVRVRAPKEDNPAASDEDRADAEAAIRFDLQYQDEVLEGDYLEERKDMLKYRGMYCVQHIPLSDEESAELDGLKIRSDLHDPFDVAWQTGLGNRLERLIVQKRRLVLELPESWQKTAGVDDDPEQDVVVIEYMDRYQHGALVGGVVAKKLAPHGYVDMNGRPSVPATLVMHTPRTIRQGLIGPQPSGVSQRGIRVGVPIMYSLLNEHVKRSRALTLAMHAAKNGSVPMIVLKGLVDSREAGEEAIDFENGVLELEDTPSSDARFMVPPNASPTLQLIIDTINQDLAAASTAAGIMQGQITQNVPGVSSNSQTSWARAKAEGLALTLSKGLSAEAGMRVAIYRQILVAPPMRNHLRAGGQPFEPAEGKQSSLYTDGVTMPIGGGREVDNLTFEDIRRIIVEVVADNRMPLEQEMQLATTLFQLADKSGTPLVSARWIREHLLHLPDPMQAEYETTLQTLAANSQTPYGRIAVLKAMLADMKVSISDPGKVDALEKQLTTLTETALMSAFQQAETELQTSMQQAAQGPTPGQPGAGPPGGGQPPPPGGAPPPQGPPPGGGIPMMLHPAPQGPPPGPPQGPPPMSNFPPPPGQPPGPPGAGIQPPPSSLIASGPISAPQPQF